MKRENTRVRNVTLAKTLELSLRGAVLVHGEWSLCRCCPGRREEGERETVSPHMLVRGSKPCSPAPSHKLCAKLQFQLPLSLIRLKTNGSILKYAW